MIKRGVFFIYIALLLCLTHNSSAQSVKLTGFVKDSVGVGLEMANVIAFNLETAAMENYAITDPSGKYQMNLPGKSIYELKVSYIGFDGKIVKINLKNAPKSFTQDIVLKESSNLLNEVEISYEMPVTVKGDTIVYNADSFQNGTEKKLEDVLEKLPGVEINDDGEVEIEGKRVTKVMVEGKDFFDGDSKIAIQNIPASALDKIEVLRNHSEVSQMGGVTNNEDNIALNIKLKKGKDRFWFGNVALGAGKASQIELEDRYVVNPKVFYYSPKTSVNLLLDLNNTGKIPFTGRDYWRFTGGFKNLATPGGTSFNVGNNGIGLSNLQNNRANAIETQFAATNFNFNPNKKFSWSGFGIFSATETSLLQNSTRSFLDVGATERIKSSTAQKSAFSLLKMSSSYQPNTTLQVDYDAFLKLSQQEEGEDRFSEINNTAGNSIKTLKDDDPYALTQNVNLYKTVDAKNILAFEAQYLLQRERPVLNSVSDSLNVKQYLDPLVYEDTPFALEQNKTTQTGRLDAKLDWYYIINDQSHLNITFGSLVAHQNFDSSLFQILENNTQINFDAANYSNDVFYRFTDLFTGVHYKFMTGKMTFEPGLKLHYYQTKDQQLGETLTLNSVRVLPDFYANYQIKQAVSLRFRYNMTNQFTDINRLSEGLLFNNYNSVYRGNRNLESAVYHRYSLNYFSFILYNYTNINGSLIYTKKENEIKNSTLVNGIGQLASSENSNLPDETLAANFRYGRTFRKIKFNAKASSDFSKFYNFRRGDLEETTVHSYSVSGRLSTNFIKAPNLSVGYLKRINDYGTATFYTDRPSIKFDALFLNSFVFKADYSYFNYYNKDKTVTNRYGFLEAELSYQKKDSPWEFILSATNLLDTRSLNRDTISQVQNTVTTLEYFVQPRFVVFTVNYSL